MRPSHSFLFISISYLSPLTISVLAADAANLAVGSRADVVSTILRPGWTSTIMALTFFTPSPGADPIPITYQSQPVTSYIPIVGYPFPASLAPFQVFQSLETRLASIT